MIRPVTIEESLAEHAAQLERLREPGQLFDLHGGRRLVLVSRSATAVTAIEFDADNVARLLVGEACLRSTLDLDDLDGLRVHDPAPRPGDAIAARAVRLYRDEIRTRLGARDPTKYIAIEPDTGRYFLGDTGTEAALAARAALPDKRFFCAPLGHMPAHDGGDGEAATEASDE